MTSRHTHPSRLIVIMLSFAFPAGCGGDGARENASASVGTFPTTADSSGSSGQGETDMGGTGDDGKEDDPAGSSTGGDGPRFDLPMPETTGPGEDCETDGCACSSPPHVPCDAGTSDAFAAIGLGCPGEVPIARGSSGPATAVGVRSSFGATNTYAPREGALYAVIGSGLVTDLDLPTPAGDSNQQPTHCNDNLGPYNPGPMLPPPLKTNNVGGDCTNDATFVGTGDCSNTIQGQFAQGGGAQDYVELRIDVDVPPDIVSFSYDFAFFSTEYPFYFGSPYNDMYIGWLESEAWTGNISFDGAGNPISLNAGFLDYRDDAGTLPELAGTCMRQHAGTGWLTTTAGVTPGEHITLAFAIFDLSDSRLDSYAFLDNFQWGCDPTGAPTTQPPG